MRDAARLSRIHWYYLVMDEGHRLKNSGCKLIALLKGYSLQHRLLLTGTQMPEFDLYRFWRENSMELEQNRD